MAAAGDAGRAPRSVADATHDLYRQYGKQIYAYCLHQLRSREEAEDAVQTTFLNAFRGLQRGTTTRFEQAWLYKIAQNVCIARRSSSGRRLKLEMPDDFEILEEIVPSGQSAGENDTLELMGLDEALDSMPENQRRAILLREWQGLSYREIADELGLSQGAVEMLIFRARRTLATALEQPAAAAKKRGSSAKTGFSFGSLIAAMKSLFSTGAALKMAAVAVSAVVVGSGASHTVQRTFELTSKPAARPPVVVAHVAPQQTAIPALVPTRTVVHRRVHKAKAAAVAHVSVVMPPADVHPKLVEDTAPPPPPAPAAIPPAAAQPAPPQPSPPAAQPSAGADSGQPRQSTPAGGTSPSVNRPKGASAMGSGSPVDAPVGNTAAGGPGTSYASSANATDSSTTTVTGPVAGGTTALHDHQGGRNGWGKTPPIDSPSTATISTDTSATGTTTTTTPADDTSSSGSTSDDSTPTDTTSSDAGTTTTTTPTAPSTGGDVSGSDSGAQRVHGNGNGNGWAFGSGDHGGGDHGGGDHGHGHGR